MYHHTPQDQATLDAMTTEEKEKRMSLTEIRIRAGQSMKEYDHWVVAPNDYPYVGVQDHLVLRFKHKNRSPHDISLIEFGKITRLYLLQGYRVMVNPPKHMSCPSRFHFHLIKH